MKTNKYLLLVAASALVITTGCDQDQLDIPQKGVIDFGDFYKTDADAESALMIAYATTQKKFSHHETNGYNYGPYFGLTNYQSDDIWFGGTGTDDCVEQREFHHFIYNADHMDVTGPYEVLYMSILKCNYVITNFTEERLGTLTDVQKKCVAEARALRAFDYLTLGIYWGTPPIVETILTVEDKPANAESQDYVMQWVADQAQMAADDLPWRDGPNDFAGAVRITKGFALAIKGKALLWKGDYAGAKAALAEVINSGNYALVPSDKMITIGHADGKGSSEAVFEFNYDGTNLPSDGYDRYDRAGWNDHNTFCMFRGGLMNGPSWADDRAYVGGWEWINPAGPFCEDLIANDGMESARRQAWIKTYDEILYDFKWAGDGDSFTPGKTAAKAKDAKRGVASGQRVFANVGYFQYKLGSHPCQGDQLDDQQPNRNFTIMRYAEVLLMYAEACAQLGETSGDGLKALNEIQNRAQSKTVSTALSLDAVKKEKRFELWLEGGRFADLVRWGDFETLKTADAWLPTLDDRINNGGSEHEALILTDLKDMEADFYVRLYGDQLGFKEKHKLLPFPQRAIDLNSNLKQNPGW